MHNDLLTALNDDRINEEPYVYPYPENEVDETTKIMKPISDEAEEGIATPITDEKTKKSNKLIIALSIIAGVIIIALISVFFIIPALTAESDVEVPDVSGMTVRRATNELEDAGLKVNSEVEEVSSDEVKEDRVVRTDPRSGRTVKEGTEVTLYVSTGVETHTLENYVNMDVGEVRNLLEDMGLTVTIEEIEPDSTTCSVIGQNLVISQSLDEGSEVASGDTITLTVLQDITFPDWYLKTEDEVTSWANNACVTVTTNYQEVADQSQVGRIITQSRPSGSTVKNNDSVTITIGRASSVNNNNNSNNNSSNNNDTNENNNQDTSTQTDTEE